MSIFIPDEYQRYPHVQVDAPIWELAPDWLTERTFLTADTHFLHQRIGEYCQRPEGWQETLIGNWNRVVSDQDILLHLGDFALGGAGRTIEIGVSLRGQKYFLYGNHDKDRSQPFMARCGFLRAYRNPYLAFVYQGRKLLFSHYPCVLEGDGTDVINLHGHIHNSPHPFPADPRYRNLSVEVRDYQPVRLGDVLVGI